MIPPKFPRINPDNKRADIEELEIDRSLKPDCEKWDVSSNMEDVSYIIYRLQK